METIELKSFAPSNIALVKYWGKLSGQFPINPSISFTLKRCNTTMEVIVSKRADLALVVKELIFDGEQNDAFASKVQRMLNVVVEKFQLPFGANLYLKTSNTFPHSSGIASSASSMAALAKILAKLYAQEHNLSWVSSVARELSGSAARSVGLGWYSFGDSEIMGSSQEYAIPIDEIVHTDYKTMQDWIFVVSKEQKKISSTAGHALMQNHPHKAQRILCANARHKELCNIVQKPISLDFFNLIVAEALELHALMMTSNPPFLLLTPQSLGIIQRINQLRSEGILCGYTLDAGPNVHMLFPKNELPRFRKLLEEKYFGDMGVDYLMIIEDECGHDSL